MLLKRIVSLAAALLFTVAAAGAATPPVLVRGTVSAFTATAITVKTATGSVVVATTAKTPFVGADPGMYSDVAPGAFIGASNVPGPGASRALEVTVFDEKLRGTGEGDYPWDAAPGHRSTMTNGTVAAPKSTMMTNGTLGKVASGDIKTITVGYKGGVRKMTVSKSTPIVRLSPGSAKLLAPDASVFVVAAKTATGLAAQFVVVGKNGTKVPI